jgi:transcriptional regulator with PAS, ATPase and Fis domain
MFFKLAKLNSTTSCEEAQKAMEMQREDIKKRMAQVEDINAKLCEAVKQTQEMAGNLSEKVNRELKIARKSLTSISSKISDGIVMIDCNGLITHMNKSASEILGISEKMAFNKHLEDFIECDNQIFDDDGNVVKKPILTEGFFKELSIKIFEQLTNNPTEEKYQLCNNVLRNEIPFCFVSDLDGVLGVKIICNGNPVSVTVTLTVLNNDPECLTDVTYIFLFSNSPK